MANTLAQHGSCLNLSDIPEVLPRSQRKATKAPQGKFEQHCRLLHHEEDQETSFHMDFSDTASVTSSLEEMFPHLDKTLIQNFQTEARTEREAIEVLLALSAAMVQPEMAQPDTTVLPKPRSLGIENHVSFPSLIDADGWQVPGKHLHEEDLGTAWCSRARAAVDKPAPKGLARPAMMTEARCGRRGQRKAADVEDMEQEPQVFTDYDYRHEMGCRRAHRRRHCRPARVAAGPVGSSESDSGGKDDVEGHQTQ